MLINLKNHVVINHVVINEKNKQIKAQNLELNSLNIEKNELIGIVAHDLTPPFPSALRVAGLFSSEKITEDQNEYLSVILSSLNRMNSLVAKILEIKVLESSSLRINYTEVELKKVTEQVISDLKIHSENKNISIVTELDNSTILTDHNLLVQILDNLVSNAIKFSNHNSKVSVTLKDENQKIRFEIDDEGSGIMEEDKPHLFKKFKKLRAQPTAGESSTGLGLSIVKKYVDAMKGKVWCESEFGFGAKFIVEFNKN